MSQSEINRKMLKELMLKRKLFNLKIGPYRGREPIIKLMMKTPFQITVIIIQILIIK
jgi:hypothetical protein